MKKIRVRIVLLILSVAVSSAVLLFGCIYSHRSREVNDEVTFLIGMSQANLGEPWRVVMNEDIKKEASKYPNLKVIFTDAAQDSQKQITDVEKLMGLGIDLLMISPNEAEPLTPIVEKAYQSIPVIVIDRDINSSNYTMFIGADNREIGRQAGNFVLELLGEKGGNVVEIEGLPGSKPATDRSEGFREVVSLNSHVKIIDNVVANWLRDKAEDEMTNKFPGYDRVDLVYAHNDPMALGAYKASQKLKLSDIMFVGIDGLPGPDGGIQMVKEGILEGTFTYPTGGKEAVEYAIKILNGEESIPKRLTLESNKVTR